MGIQDSSTGIRFAVYVPVGPDEIEVQRTGDLLESLWFHEPTVQYVLLVDDAPTTRNLNLRFRPPERHPCKIFSLRRKAGHRGDSKNGGLSVLNLLAVAWIVQNALIDFLLKCDTDALVIGRFSQSVAAAFHSHSQVGLIGTLGPTCNRAASYFRDFSLPAGMLRLALERIPKESSNACIVRSGEKTFNVSRDHLRGVNWVRPEVEFALKNGYRLGHYCQGGAYAISAEMCRRMVERGYTYQPERWLHLPAGEDVVIGMHSHAVGLEMLDFSGEGQPFGIQHEGLAFPPEELLRRGHALIHSVKNDRAFSEESIREFFRDQRRI